MPEIRIDWIRHGLSCANILPAFDLELSRSTLTPDAALTDCGVKQAQETGKYFIDELNKEQKYDIVVCSHLLRAIETALNLFINRQEKEHHIDKIYVVPYISENGITPDNKSKGEDETMSYLEDKYPNIKNIKNVVDWTIFNKLSDSDINPRNNYDTFINTVVPHILVNQVVHENRNEPKLHNIRIACVSHSEFMHDHFNKYHFNQEKILLPKNTQILSEKLNYFKKEGSGTIAYSKEVSYYVDNDNKYIKFIKIPFQDTSTKNTNICEYTNQPNLMNIKYSEGLTGLVYTESGFDDPKNSKQPDQFKKNSCNYKKCGDKVVHKVDPENNHTCKKLPPLKSKNVFPPNGLLSKYPPLPPLPLMNKNDQNKNDELIKTQNNKNITITILTFNEGEANKQAYASCIHDVVSTLEKNSPSIICILSQEAKKDSFHKALSIYFATEGTYKLLTKGVFGRQSLPGAMPLCASLYLSTQISENYKIENVDDISCSWFRDCFSTEFTHKTEPNCGIKVDIKYEALSFFRSKHALGIDLEINDPIYKTKILIVDTHLPFGGNSDTPKNRHENLEQIIESSNPGFDLITKFNAGYSIFIAGDLNFRNHCDSINQNNSMTEQPTCFDKIISTYRNQNLQKNEKLKILKNELFNWLNLKISTDPSNELYKNDELYQKLVESVYIDFPTCRYIDKEYDDTKLKFTCDASECNFNAKLLDNNKKKVRPPSTCDQILTASRDELLKHDLLPISSCSMKYSDHLGLVGSYEIVKSIV